MGDFGGVRYERHSLRGGHYTKTYVIYIRKTSGETQHPDLPDFVLSFQPSNLSAPSWIKRVTNRRRGRDRPRMLAPGEGTFTEVK